MRPPPRAAAISSVTALPTGRAASQARYSARAAAGRSCAHPRSMSSAPCSMLPAGLCAATQICSSLTHTAQLPSGVRGGLAVAVGERADGGEGAQRPVEEGLERGVGGGRGARLRGDGGRAGPRLVVHLAALRAQFGDPLLQQVEQLRHGDRAGGQLEEGQHLRHGRHDLGDGGGLVVLGFGAGEGPGVAEGDPAAQHGAVVAVPGAQPPAGSCAVAVHLDEAGQPGGVPVGPDLIGGQAEGLGGAAGGRVGQGGLAVGGGAVAAGAEGAVGPAGHAGGRGQDGSVPFRPARPVRACSPGARRGAARTPLLHRGGGGGQGSRADESKPGVARDTGRHGCSLPVDGPKTQTECRGRLGVRCRPAPDGAGGGPIRPMVRQ